jgi:hypothetical protein
MRTALSSLLLLIDHAKQGHLDCMQGCDNYEKSVVYAQVLRLMGFQADLAEGSFAVKVKGIKETHLALSGLSLPSENIDFISPHGDVGVDNAMNALAKSVRGNINPNETYWISRMEPGSISVESFIGGLSPEDRMTQAINIGHAFLQSQALEEDCPQSPAQPRPRF